jgi:hypothetical protein
MLVSKDILQDLAYCDCAGDNNEYNVIQNDLVGSDRWSLAYKMIFSFNGKYYVSCYSVGATEMQDEKPYEYSPDMIECTEVVKKKVLVDSFVPIEE